MIPRNEMIQRVEWNSGGLGFGICRVANFMTWAMDEPGPGKPDLKSIVALCVPADKYTDEELEKIVAFSERVTARYDEMFKHRRGVNLILIDKCIDGRWLRKRLSWTMGSMYSDTLDEALAVFDIAS